MMCKDILDRRLNERMNEWMDEWMGFEFTLTSSSNGEGNVIWIVCVEWAISMTMHKWGDNKIESMEMYGER